MITNNIVGGLTSNIAGPIIKNSGPSSPYLDGVLDGVCFELDATDEASYSTGQKWLNLITNPACGSLQTDYDFYLGLTGSSESSDPTFTGTAGDPGAYFLLDGGDDFNLVNSTNPGILRDFQKTGASAVPGWLGWVHYPDPTTTSNDQLLNTVAGTSPGTLMDINSGANGEARLRVRGDANLITATGPATTDASYNLIVVTHDHDNNETTFWVNSTTGVTVAHTFDSTTSDASQKATLWPDNTVESGARAVWHGGGLGLFDDTKAAALFTYLNNKHSRTYA